MVGAVKKYPESSKRLCTTIGLLGLQLCLLIMWSCIEEPGYIEGCPRPKVANAIGIKSVFFSPYRNQRYSSATDTVELAQFGFNFELEIQELEAVNTGSLPGRAYALSCIPAYTIGNISNLSVVLLAPFAGLPVGTDISYLLITPEGKKISELREFQNVSVYFGSKLSLTPSNYAQLKTRTFLFLKNGTQKAVDSTSPFIKTK